MKYLDTLFCSDKSLIKCEMTDRLFSLNLIECRAYSERMKPFMIARVKRNISMDDTVVESN